MKEALLQTFTILLMVCIIVAIILYRQGEFELRYIFLAGNPPGNLGRTSSVLRKTQAIPLKDSLSKSYQASIIKCKSLNPEDCKIKDGPFEYRQLSINVSKRSSKQNDKDRLTHIVQLNVSASISQEWKQPVIKTSDGLNLNTSDGDVVSNSTDWEQTKHFGDETTSTIGLKSKQIQASLANMSHDSKFTAEPYQSQGKESDVTTSNDLKTENQFNVDLNIWGNDTMGLQSDGSNGYLVYDCSKSHKENCGGWSDRLSGILSTLVLSTLTNRTFKINFDSPCVLSEYLRPNLYDWTIGHSDFENKSTSYHVLTNSRYHKMGKELTPKGLYKYFQSDVAYIRMNWDLTRQFRKYPNIQKYAAWITELHFSDIYFKLFNTLFKPSQEIVQDLTNIRKNATRSKTACAHLRIGGNPSMRNDRPRSDKNRLKVVWSLLDKLDTNIYNIFIATDDDSVRKMSRERYKHNFIDIQGSIMHIDQSSYRRGDVCEGFRKQLLDFLFLTSCDILLLSNSGFGMMAAYLRTHKTGLYCWTDSGIVPCSRYTVHDFYPLPILAPE
ncbi:uncharacterized protein LOC132556657 [Ylistrum balloti]|uniref:uncharacterized protein LOC132556657 n=1 Tax=Ylistrum balloti TaxID=509963 RepID=UPI002905D264|nr:uncharacterized protein LOC132556657 [Ylistrum balloti]